ncbi:MAG: lamin tail domain-containing protein, partial [Planctomycetes bacterium]|nr:lamin tail domain-containing protein [Planctomycetota bacterium]
GWYLSDSGGNLQKFRLPDGTTIPAGGYLVFDENDFGFGLNGSNGEEVFLVTADAAGGLTHFADSVQFGAAMLGESFGRWPNAEGELYPMTSPTLDPPGPNSGPRIGPVIISEIMYHPQDPGDTIDPGDLEFVEIYNPTDQTVDLTHWGIGGGVAHDFAPGTLLAANETLLVVRFDPALEDMRDVFQRYYQIDDSVNLVGGFSTRLSNRGEKVQLLRAIDSRLDGRVIEDEVTYDDEAPWPEEADGAGHSLHRGAIDAWGNSPLSWTAQPPTPGQASLSRGPVADLTGDGWVDFQDLTILLAHWNQRVSAAHGNLVDPTHTQVDFQDLTLLLAAWTGPGESASPQAAVSEASSSARETTTTASRAATTAHFDRLGRRERAMLRRANSRSSIDTPLRRLQATAVDGAMGDGAMVDGAMGEASVWDQGLLTRRRARRSR